MEVLNSFGSYLRRYEGHGTLWLSGRHRRAVSFDLRQLEDGDLVVACQSPVFMEMFDARRLEGKVVGGGYIEASDFRPLSSTVGRPGLNHGVSKVRRATWSRGIGGVLLKPTLTFDLVNLVRPEWIGGPSQITLRAGGYSFRLERHDDYVSAVNSLHRGSGQRVTARCMVSRDGSRPLDPQDAEHAMDDLCFALSLAVGNKVTWTTAELTDWYRSHQRGIRKGYSPWIYGLDWSLDLRKLTNAWDKVERKTYYRRMIDYFLDAGSEDSDIETRALVAASLLDAITGEYARSRREDLWVNDRRWHLVGAELAAVIDDVAERLKIDAPLSSGVNNLQRRSLRKRLRGLFSEHGLPVKRIADIIDVRNEVVHYGRLPKQMDIAFAYETVLWGAYVVLASLIGYDGDLPDPPQQPEPKHRAAKLSQR